jgi:phosphohistidine swiveling domain-containing protein
MNTGLEARKAFSEGSVPGLEDQKIEKVSAEAYIAAKVNGRGASAGRAVGWAAVVKTQEDLQRVREGAIIVAPTASRGLITIMREARAVVTEVGGIGASAFRYARECDIPAVTGVEDFTKAVQEGDLLLVDGTNGFVEILRRKVSRKHG